MAEVAEVIATEWTDRPAPRPGLERNVFDRFGRVWLVAWRAGFWDHVTLCVSSWDGYRMGTIQAPTPGGCISDPRYNAEEARTLAARHTDPRIAAALREAADLFDAWRERGELPTVG